jgi:serine/threonine-protein kinase
LFVHIKLLKVNVLYVESKVTPKGQVMAQEPEAGSELPKGAAVKITVSQGVVPLTKATVPKVVGLPEAQARAVLTTAGFEVTVTYVASDGSNTGLVVSQTPTAGTTAFKKTVITLQVAK